MILYYISHWFFCTMDIIILILPNPYKCIVTYIIYTCVDTNQNTMTITNSQVTCGRGNERGGGAGDCMHSNKRAEDQS